MAANPGIMLAIAEVGEIAHLGAKYVRCPQYQKDRDHWNPSV